MATRNDQAFCTHCNKPTLHVSHEDDVPHVLHAIATLFLCGLWLPIWIIHSLTAKVEPWRCSQCGQQHGAMTPAQQASAAKQQAVDAQRRKVASYHASVARDKAIQGVFDRTYEAFADFVDWSWDSVARADRAVLGWADDNRPIGCLFWLLIVATPPALGLFVYTMIQAAK